MFTRLRPALLTVFAVLVQIFGLNPELAAIIEANAANLLTGLSAAWAIIAWFRNRSEATYAGENESR